jgi:hypothetical protein
MSLRSRLNALVRFARDERLPDGESLARHAVAPTRCAIASWS